MRIATFTFAALLLALSVTAQAAPAPHWRNGDLICPDGSVGKPAIMPHARPTARDLDDACAMRAQDKRLRDVANRPVRTENLQQRQRERNDVANFLGKPK